MPSKNRQICRARGSCLIFSRPPQSPRPKPERRQSWSCAPSVSKNTGRSKKAIVAKQIFATPSETGCRVVEKCWSQKDLPCVGLLGCLGCCCLARRRRLKAPPRRLGKVGVALPTQKLRQRRKNFHYKLSFAWCGKVRASLARSWAAGACGAKISKGSRLRIA